MADYTPSQGGPYDAGVGHGPAIAKRWEDKTPSDSDEFAPPGVGIRNNSKCDRTVRIKDVTGREVSFKLAPQESLGTSVKSVLATGTDSTPESGDTIQVAFDGSF